ncbi:hypothetical protein AWR38_00405 [Idiomarina sp. WRN-38]|jgi:hypothetical protein|nr:hypothetical protein AUR68_00405 [Idiomarina sp. H105]OAE97902.1 hypothetical protein AWR38_00405 [Idiomarina sp. WRN-38]
MATAPAVPNFAATNFALGDDDEAIDKQNAQNAMLVSYFGQFGAFAQQLENEQQQTLDSANQTLQSMNGVYQNVVQERQAAQTARQEAEAARDQAQQIAVGTVGVTELQPGALENAMDYVSVNENGDALVVRNFETDFSEQLAGGYKRASLARYDVAWQMGNTGFDLGSRQVFRIDATQQRTLTIANHPGENRAMVVVVKLFGNVQPLWPSQWQGAWVEGVEPLLGATKTTIVGWWDGDEWELSVRSKV